jgi:hypothetical protein
VAFFGNGRHVGFSFNFFESGISKHWPGNFYLKAPSLL